jgi:hypothetical protein
MEKENKRCGCASTPHRDEEGRANNIICDTIVDKKGKGKQFSPVGDY